MSSPITLNRLARTNPPVYEGTHGGKAIEVRLDNSAVMKLQGHLSYEQRAGILAPIPPQIADAASRLIERRQAEQDSQSIVVTISALDLS